MERGTPPDILGVVRMIIHEEGPKAIRTKLDITFGRSRTIKYLKRVRDGKLMPTLKLIQDILAVSNYYLIPTLKDEWESYQDLRNQPIKEGGNCNDAQNECHKEAGGTAASPHRLHEGAQSQSVTS